MKTSMTLQIVGASFFRSRSRSASESVVECSLMNPPWRVVSAFARSTQLYNPPQLCVGNYSCAPEISEGGNRAPGGSLGSSVPPIRGQGRRTARGQGEEPPAGKGKNRPDDRVGYRGLRPGTLPHHRTYGFPYPAVGPSGLTACRKTGRSPEPTACRTSCIAFCQEFRGSRSGSHRRRPAAAPPHLPSPAPRLVPPAGKDLPARDSGKPLRRCARFSSSFAPWSFSPSLQRRYPPSRLLRRLLTSPPRSHGGALPR